MEPSPSTKFTLHNSEKSVSTGRGSGSISASMEKDVAEFSSPPSLANSETPDQNQVMCHEVIDVNKDENTQDLVTVEEKYIEDSKGKISMPSCLGDLDVAPSNIVHSSISMPSRLGDLDVAPSNIVHSSISMPSCLGDLDVAPSNIVVLSSESFGPISHNLTIADESSHDMSFSDDDAYMNDDEFAMMQAHFDSLDISPGVEAPIPWWPSCEGNGTQGVSPSSSAFINSSSFTNAGTYTGTSLDPFNSSKYLSQPFPMPSSGEKPYNEPWPSTLHNQHKLPTWSGYSMSPSGMMVSSSSDAKAGNLSPSGTTHPLDSMKIKMLQLSNTTSGDHNNFTGWKIQGADEPNFPADLTQNDFTGSFMGGFQYLQDHSVVLDQRIAEEISVPSDSASSNQKDDSEAGILKRLESFKKFDTVQDHSDHHYSSKTHSRPPSKEWVKKIQEDWRILEKDLPGDAIFVRVYETRMDLLRAVIVGADGTPYHDGTFFFDFYFPPSYPYAPPLVYYRSGGLRLNPNLYNCGKVCLSLLNTWGGDKNEMWVPSVSTVLQVLVSVQGLILNVEPYFNEPGYEDMAGTPEGEKCSRRYNESAFLLSLKTMLYSMRQPPKYFEDFVFGHFYNSAHDILKACKAYIDGAQVGTLVKGAIQDVEGDNNKFCSNTFKMHLPMYINSLAKAFTKIGVADCEKYTVPVNNTDGAVAEKASSSSKPHGFPKKLKQKFEHVDLEKA